MTPSNTQFNIVSKALLTYSKCLVIIPLDPLFI